MTGPQIVQPVPPGGGGSTPSVPVVVQHAFAADASGDGVTLTSTPVQGNMLVALFGQNLTGNLASGWVLINSTNAGTDYGVIAYKIAGAGESKTQNPSASAGAGAVAMYEISNGGFSFNNVVNATTAGPSVAVTTARAAGLIIGAFERADTTALTAIVGAVVDGHAEANSRGITGFTVAAPVDGVNTISGTFGVTSANTKAMAVAIY